MTTPRSQQQAIRTSGERLIEFILGDSDIVDLVSSRAITTKITSGELVSGDQLRLGQFELVPVGTVANLEAAIDAALAALDAGSPDEAMRALEATIPAPPDDGEADDNASDGSAANDGPDDAVPAMTPPRRRVDPGQDNNPAETDGRPQGMPVMDCKYDCVACQAVVDGTRAQLAWTRFRVILCGDCMTHWDPATGSVKDAPQSEPST